METSFITDRLTLVPLTADDNVFIEELVNTKGWLAFIGDRNVHSEEDALLYIEKIKNNTKVTYWVVKTKDNNESIGVITLIKREYLEHHDIGFAFLPAYNGKGYAYEAAKEVLNNIINGSNHTHILATTIPSNINSIKLLQRLGLQFEKEIEVEKEILHVFAASTDNLRITDIINNFFDVFTNKDKRQPNFELLTQICIPEVMFIHKTETEHKVYRLESFIEPRKKILSDGTLTSFEEHEIFGENKIINNIAHRYAQYAKSGVFEGKAFSQKGNKFLQFVKTNDSWKISSVIWEDEIN